MMMGTSQERASTIACLGWGSLIWDPQELPCRGGWSDDGPLLPIEFARESGGDRITLVICEVSVRVRALWTLLDALDIQTARQKLAAREGIKGRIDLDIGFWERASGKAHGLQSETIATWAARQDLDGVVWTNLPCGFRNSREVMPSADAVVAHLRALDATKRPKAEEYVRRAPMQIATPYRRSIEKELGWHPEA